MGALTRKRRKVQIEAGVKKKKKKRKPGKLWPALTQKKLDGFLGVRALDLFLVPQTGRARPWHVSPSVSPSLPCR